MQRPRAMGLGRVHVSEPLRRLPRQDAVGEHARRVPHAHPRCTSRHVRHEPPDMCALGRVAPLQQRHHTGRTQAFPLNRIVARQHATPAQTEMLASYPVYIARIGGTSPQQASKFAIETTIVLAVPVARALDQPDLSIHALSGQPKS